MPSLPRGSRILLAIGLAAAQLGQLASAQTRDHVVVVGSSTVFPFAAAVAEAFARDGHWKAPVVESIGTGGGFRLFCKGPGLDTPDITDASRPMTDDERDNCRSHEVGTIVGIRIGTDGIVIASSKRSPHFDLTREQLYRAIAKTVPIDGRLVANPYRRWRDVSPGLPDQAISILGPAPNHGTRDAFVALAMTPPCEMQPEVRTLSKDEQRRACQTVREDGAWIDVAGDYQIMIGKLVNDPGAVAILTFSYLDKNPDRLQAARIDGVAASVESISAWTYPLARPLFLYVKRAHVGRVPGLAEYVQEFVSNRAAGTDGYLVDKGLAPQPAAWLEVERGKAAALSAPRH
jgi:phosphate transport system substrate-binding protein